MLGVRSFHESFYGTPRPVETGRRGKKRQAKPKEEPENEIAVIGIHYRSFDDDSMAAFVNSPAAQVPWNGDKNLLIDRYDVRHLLQDLSGIRRRRRPPSPDANKEELDYERYRDLEGLENPEPPPEDDSFNNENESGGQYARVGFTYSSGGNQSGHGERVDRTTEEAAFVPSFFVPEHLVSKLPSTLKVHQIMAGTAKYVIEHGGQAEIVLRVKQASNPTFGFLMPDHYQHEYFRFLVENPQFVGISNSTQPVAAVELLSEEAAWGLSLLGTAYGDSDDEEEDDDEANVTKTSKQEQQEITNGENLEHGDEVRMEGIEGSEHGSHNKKSPIAGGLEDGTCDTGDSIDASKAPEVPGSESHDEVLVKVEGDGSLAGLSEPLPPGTEELGSVDGGNDEGNVPPGDYGQELPPYKEPPLQQRRIIDKMVEFISRNGKEFEAIVRERDKKDGRFQFLLPWNEYYPFFSQSLEAAQQADDARNSPADGTALNNECRACPATGVVLDDQLVNDHFLKGVPFWDESSGLDTTTCAAEAEAPENEENLADKSHNGFGGMGFDAVMAAVRAATRGLPRAVETGELASSQPKSPEAPEMGSDDAVLAAIRFATGATRRSKVEDPVAGCKSDIVQLGESRASTGASDPNPVHVVVANREDETKSPESIAPPSSFDPFPGSEGDVVVVAKAAALAAGLEGDSADALLTPAEKRRAERLKKAKLFAAMIRDGNGVVRNTGQGSGSHGVSASPTTEKCSQAPVGMDVNAMDTVSERKVDACISTGNISVEENVKSREQTGEALVSYVDEVDDTQEAITNTRMKEKKHKSKSRETDEKYRKHHKKRKSLQDVDEDNSNTETEQRRDWRHDHYQDEERKDRRRRQLVEVRNRDKNDYANGGKADKGRYGHDLEEPRKESRESKNDRRHRGDGDGKRESRHGYDLEERWYDSRHGYDSDRRERSSRRRHGSEEKRKETRYDSDDEKRKDSKYEIDVVEKRKERGRREDSQERRKDSRHRHDPDEKKKDRRHSHGKRKKHKEDHVQDLNEGEIETEKHVQKRSRRHRHESSPGGTGPRNEKPSRPHGDTTVDRIQRDVGTSNEHAAVDHLPIEKLSAVEEEPPAITPIDVPDDIRAKVRAMLGLM